MPISPSDFERIEAYVAGHLSVGERTQFETELSKDSELASETARLRALRTGLRRLTYRDELAARHAELIERGAINPVQTGTGRVRPLGQTRPLWQSFAVAASVALLLGLGWFFLKPNPSSTPSPADMAGRFLIRGLRLDSTTRNGEPLLTGPGPDQLARRQAITRDTVAIRSGLTLLQQGKPADAIVRLQPARNCLLLDWQANARYLLALAYLQTNQVAQAKTELVPLRQTPYFSREADRLLHELAENP